MCLSGVASGLLLDSRIARYLLQLPKVALQLLIGPDEPVDLHFHLFNFGLGLRYCTRMARCRIYLHTRNQNDEPNDKSLHSPS